MEVVDLIRDGLSRQDAMAYSLLGIVCLDFFGLVISAWILWMTRDGNQRLADANQRLAEMLAEMRKDSKRMEHYLFRKLGPADLR